MKIRFSSDVLVLEAAERRLVQSALAEEPTTAVSGDSTLRTPPDSRCEFSLFYFQ